MTENRERRKAGGKGMKEEGKKGRRERKEEGGKEKRKEGRKEGCKYLKVCKCVFHAEKKL